VRPSGGGAVVLAPGVVTASVLLTARADERFPEPHFRCLCGAVAEALSGCGVHGVALRGVSDLCLGDRKVAGSSLRLWSGRVLFQISLLVAVDIGLLERYLRHPSREPGYRNGRPHREFVTSLREAGFGVTVDEVVVAVRGRLERETAARLGA
jgi:lipoate---protein ligase